jgi:hypothetical protein
MNEQNKGNALLTLRILYFGMLTGTLLFGGIIYFISQGDETAPLEEFRRNIFVITLFVAAIVLSVSSFMWTRDIRNIQEKNGSLQEKFNSYRAASIRRYAFTEFAALLSIIFYWLTKEPKLYIAIAILIVHFFTLYPSSSKIAGHIGENAEDIEKLQS